MEKLMRKIVLFCSVVTALCFYASDSNACTGVTMKAKDGSFVFGRTLEFAHKMNSEVIVIPRNMKFIGATPAGKDGLQWKSKFAATGANFNDTPVIIDGINEKGLSCGMFYFPKFAAYQKVVKSDYSKTIAPWQLATWVLTNFESVSEVKANLTKIKVASVVFKKWDMVIPLHAIVTDAKGNSIVIEYTKGQLNIYDNKYGVFTNAPTFDWMTTNIQNYLTLSPNNAPGITIAGKKLTPFGEGSGMFGVPGDFTPPSRFIRALFFSLASLRYKNSKDTAMQVFHILNNFDIPKGTVRSDKGEATAYDWTQWTAVHDLDKKNYYYKTEGNSRVRVVKLMNCKLNAKKILKLTMDSSEDIQDVTSNLK